MYNAEPGQVHYILAGDERTEDSSLASYWIGMRKLRVIEATGDIVPAADLSAKPIGKVFSGINLISIDLLKLS